MSALTVKNIGIIGFGSFGALFAELMSQHVPVVVHSRRELAASDLPQNVAIGSFEDVAACDIVVIATELAGLDITCERISKLVKPQTIVMDVCSVKVLPARIMQKYLSGRCRLLGTHPLFGPHSIKSGGTKDKVVVWHELSGGPFPELEAFMQNNFGFKIVKMDDEAHDREMAWVHGLTFFVGRGLLELKLPELTLPTGYYEKLLALTEIEKDHSYELFRTVQLGNPYTDEVRKKYVEALEGLEERLSKDSI